MIKINKNIIFSYNKAPIIIAEISGNHGGNKKDNTTDSKFSIAPNELADFAEINKKINVSLNKKINHKIQSSSKKLRRSIYSVSDIKKREKFTKKNIDTLRPNLGISANKYFYVLGKKSKKNILSASPIKIRHLKK
jgi:sialic acid synthase SpsE